MAPPGPGPTRVHPGPIFLGPGPTPRLGSTRAHTSVAGLEVEKQPVFLLSTPIKTRPVFSRDGGGLPDLLLDLQQCRRTDHMLVTADEHDGRLRAC